MQCFFILVNAECDNPGGGGDDTCEVNQTCASGSVNVGVETAADSGACKDVSMSLCFCIGDEIMILMLLVQWIPVNRDSDKGDFRLIGT